MNESAVGSGGGEGGERKRAWRVAVEGSWW